VVLSDRSIREEISQGRLVIDAPADGCIQPSSVDLRLSTPAEALYGSPGMGSKHQGQEGPTASRAHQDFQKRTD
jgi:deoxycytidine triphosphate deaminase